MSKTQVKNIVKEYADKLKVEGYPFSAIYLFGSYAQGRANKWSDIDVAVISDKLKRNWWKNEVLLSHISLEVDSRIEPHGFTVEDFKKGYDPMVYEIKKTGIKI
ncbi:nucleotidyltransferase domain-containing protein [Patescibacteria group bacterium]|nr:nucleotidyltransferase domain-containing protein [Patescibacteria group bacterium]